ncbi:hypothetical protein C8C77_105108 [Halanaerobium saccharolyticum]|uniref:Uncharacterized protein n=1 Tax=Halanaerobium saccharolyticum TaxID=43595 RepID=A0A4R7Z9G8_9FIRM|nr:hypothetical protein [Halanaerobium saccharolyticum]RAK12546.1 hypothetical protein C7958_101108 [Halanaerobium saccharolyticum]TDW06472.1 hypothetical protein C8C77_105108 [Halanaerobium saccharolyticum]TDX61720.1 hypothetical protein C7956_105108 [Halanaerobium saccharolyticum]
MDAKKRESLKDAMAIYEKKSKNKKLKSPSSTNIRIKHDISFKENERILREEILAK